MHARKEPNGVDEGKDTRDLHLEGVVGAGSELHKAPGKGPGDDPAVVVAADAPGDGPCLAAPRLPIGEHRGVVALYGTQHRVFSYCRKHCRLENK